jgi:hypothetical protein
MNVLTHGTPFFCSYAPIELYEGPHDIRTVGNFAGAQYRYDPLTETAHDVVGRIRREWAPDLLLCWMPEIHPPPPGIEESPIPTVALVSDWNVFYPILNINLSRYDVVLCDTPGTVALESDQVSPTHLFPLYSQITPIHRPYGQPKDIDVVFVGNLNHASHPVPIAENDERRQKRYLKAFVQAHRLSPASAPYALNAATAFQSCGLESQEADYLNGVLLATDLAGAENVVGAVASPFYIRWHRALSEKRTTPAMVHAEAHIRMSTILARRGEPGLAEEHLLNARALDPVNVGGRLLLAEIQWADDRRSEASDTLRTSLPDMPMDPAPRDRLCSMLVEMGLKHEARILAEETLRILRACAVTPTD